MIQINRIVNTEADQSHCLATSTRSERFSLLVIPLLSDRRIALSARLCAATARWSFQLPRIDDQQHDDGWRQPAERCLAEISGQSAKQWSLLGNVYIDPQLMSSSIIVILAENCYQLPFRSCPNINQAACSIAFSIEALKQMIREGDIDCGVTIAGLALWLWTMDGE